MNSLYIVLLVLAALFIICIGIVLFDICTFKTTNYSLTNSKVTKEYSFVVISDLHGWRFGRGSRRLIARIDALKPDGIIIAGDMLTSSVHTRPEKMSFLLNELAKRYQIYYGMGNHEERLNRMTYRFGTTFLRYKQLLKGSGIHFLMNECLELPEYNIRIYGLMLTNDYFIRFGKKPLKKDAIIRKIGSASQTKCNLLIAHNPEYFPEYADWGDSIVLSGHNHGGIIGIPFVGGLISPKFTFFPKYDGGKYEEKGSIMLLSRGLGTHTIPIRFLNRAELLYVKLKPEE